MGRWLSVILDGGAPPDALWMLCILPEIENVTVVELPEWNAVRCIHDGEDSFVVFLVIGITFQQGERARILRLDPGERFFSVHILKPEVWVFRAHRLSR